MTRIRAALRRDEGASAVEYGLLIAGIAALVIGVVFLLGNRVSSVFNHTSTCIAAKGSSC